MLLWRDRLNGIAMPLGHARRIHLECRKCGIHIQRLQAKPIKVWLDSNELQIRRTFQRESSHQFLLPEPEYVCALLHCDAVKPIGRDRVLVLYRDWVAGPCETRSVRNRNPFAGRKVILIAHGINQVCHTRKP